jgi:hypothetical protein
MAVPQVTDAGDARASLRTQENALSQIVEWIVATSRRSPWLPVAFLDIVSWIMAQPWGNYGLNDDWVYAHVAKDFAATGSIHLIPTAASALGPAVLAYPILRIFGFSHLYLRLMSMALAILGLWAIDRLLAHVTRSVSLRILALLLLAFNPIYFYSTTSYMTEIHGWVPSLLLAVLWLWERRRVDARGDPSSSAVSFWVSTIVAVGTGSTFWTRQWCVLTYPALLGATLLNLVLERRWKAVGRTALVSFPGLALFGAAIYSFFPWARATGNLRPEFVGQFPNITKFDGDVFIMQAGGALVYLTAFFLPLLALLLWGSRQKLLHFAVAAALLGLALYARAQYEMTATQDYSFGTWTHQTFPYVVNIIYNAGIGPVTVDDVFGHDLPRQSWPKGVWVSLEVLFVAATVRWSPIWVDLAKLFRAIRGTRLEVTTFGTLLAAGCLVAALQVYKNEINDRYYLPLTFGLILVVPAVLALPSTRQQLSGAARWAMFSLFFLPMAWFSVAGVHDEFRWQDARWQLLASALNRGANHATVQSGWEVNCWWRYEELTRETAQCEGGCACAGGPGFCCVDDRFRVGMGTLPGYHVVESIQPKYWLASGPPMVLSRR